MSTTPDDDLEIRPADPADSAALTALAHAVWPVAYAYTDPGFAQDTIDRWWSDEANLRSMSDTTVLVAVRAGEIVGLGNVDLRPEVPVIWKLAVHPAEQGRGTGRALLERLLAVVPAGPVRLTYAEGNEPAAGFYRRCGFVEVGRSGSERSDWPGDVLMQWTRPA